MLSISVTELARCMPALDLNHVDNLARAIDQQDRSQMIRDLTDRCDAYAEDSSVGEVK